MGEKKINGNVTEIETRLQQNEVDKTERHEKTLGEAKEFTNDVKKELDIRAEGLENNHQALRTEHDTLEGVVSTHTNNLGVTQKFILDRFGRKQTWDADIARSFGPWAEADDVQPVVGSENGQDEVSGNDRRRLAADSAPLTPSERALARRRLMNRPKSHTVVLEALLEEINRLN